MRVWALVASAQVVPGRILSVSGDRGPEGNRKSTVTVSVARPGLKMSTSEEPPGTSWAWGIVQCGWGEGAPGTSDSPPEVPPGPTSSCTSDATTRPVRVATTVLMLADVLHLRRHLLHRHLARRQHDALVVDRVDHAARCQEAEVDHDGRRRGIEQRDVEQVGGGAGAVGEVPLRRRRALARRLGPAQGAVHRLGDRHAAARGDHGLGLPGARRGGGDGRGHHAAGRDGNGGVHGGTGVGDGGDAGGDGAAPSCWSARGIPATRPTPRTARCSTRRRTRHRARRRSALGAGVAPTGAGVPRAPAATATPTITTTARATTRHRRSRLWWAGVMTPSSR